MRESSGDIASIDLKAMFSAMPVATALIDRLGRQVVVNEAFAALGGVSANTLVGRELAELTPAIARELEDDFHRCDAGLELPEHEAALGGRTFRVAVKPVRAGGERVTGLVVSLVDITRSKETERRLAEANGRLERFARKDALTGLWNKRHFDEVLVRQISRSLRELTPMSLVLFDVDRLAGLNDACGREAGDGCLRNIAKAVRQHLRRPGDEACRHGDDEFAVLLPNTNAAGAAHLAETLRAAVDRLQIAHPRIPHGRVTVSLGVANLDVSGLDVPAMRDELAQSAGKALSAAKSAGRNAVRVWATALGDVGWGEPENGYFLGTLLAGNG